jgi:HEPN domain-containing protein
MEKCLKAVLIGHDVAFRKTHSLVELLDLLADAGQPAPPHADTLDELDPYAVEYRYGMVEPKSLDRNRIQRLLDAVRQWAGTQIR